MKTFHFPTLLAGLILAIAASPIFGATTIISDNYNVTASVTGFSLDTGVNTGINPPTATRLTGTAPASANLRYINTGDRSGSLYTIAGNKISITNGSNAGRFTLGTGSSTPYSFASVLGTGSATSANPTVYDIKISIVNTDNDNDRTSFGFGTVEGDNTTWDFGVQLYQVLGDAKFSIGKLVDTSSSGVADLKADITGQKNVIAVGAEVAFLIRVFDAGAESSGYSSSGEGFTRWRRNMDLRY